MLQRLFAVIAMAVLVVGCGGEDAEKQREGVKATAIQPPEKGEEGKRIAAKIAEVGKAASTSLEKQDVEKVPLSTEFYLLTDAYEETGFLAAALKKKVEEAETKGIAYVKLTLFNGLPEVANIYDDMGNHLFIVSYLWDENAKVYGAVHKGANDRMLAMYLYCAGTTDMYVHDLSTFRVHAPFTRKVIANENSLVVQFVDGHDLKGELPVWPECKDVEEAQEKAAPYQSPFGVHKEAFNFDEAGNLKAVARYDLKGALVEDVRGIAKRELNWVEGRIAEEAFFTADDLLARYKYAYDGKGRVLSIDVVDQNGAPALDYFGVAYYTFTRDKRGRVKTETRKDLKGAVDELHEFTYAKFNQAETHIIKDGDGTVQTSLINKFNKKGARLEMAIYDGEAAAGKLKVDANGVALYRFAYTDKGKGLTESRHAPAQVVDKDGKQDYQLTNGLDGWAMIRNEYDKESGKVANTTSVRVDDQGNKVFDEVVNTEGRLQFRIERTFENSVLISSVKTLYNDQRLAEKKLFYDAADKVVRVALLQHNADGLLMEVGYFAEDEQTPVMNPEGYHKLVKSYREDQKIKALAYFDMAGAKVKTTLFEYAEDGKFKGKKHYDAEGKEIKEAR